MLSKTRFTTRFVGNLAVGGLALFGSSVMAVTIFSDDFSASTLNVTPGTPAANSTTYEVASTKNTSSSIAAGDLELMMASTSSGFIEAQALFASSPVVLSNPGDYVDFTMVFTNSGGILLSGKSNSSLTMGLFSAGGVAPLAGVLTNSGLTATAGSPYATGGAQLWQGYVGRIIQSGTAQLLERPPQNGSGTTSANQDLLFNNVGGGAFANPSVSAFKQQGSSVVALTSGSVYTAYLRLTYDGVNMNVTNALFAGANTSGTQLFGLGGSTNNATLSFDGLAFGWRYSGASGDPSSAMDVNSILVTTNVIPEPSTVILVLLGLGFAVGARRLTI